MAKIQLQDLFQATLWTNDVLNEAPELKNILNSPLITTSPDLQSVVNATNAGSRFEMPYIDEPDYTEPEAMDDSDDEITTNKLAWANMFAVLGLYSKAYKYSHLAALLARDSDPARVIRDVIGNYWGRDLQRRMINILVGISKKAGADLTLDAGDNGIDTSVIIDGASLLGDHQDKFEEMFIHSKIYADLKKQNLIDVIPPSEEGAKPIEVYGNYKVTVNDLMPVEEDADGNKHYTTIIAQRGIFAFAQKELGGDMPLIELHRNPLTGKGSGNTTVISRQGFVLHPVGWSWKKSGMSPTLADLAKDTNWEKKFQTKQQRFVKIVTK